MLEAGGLLLDGGDDARVRVPDVDDRDAGAEIDETIAVDVLDDPALRVGDEDRERGADRGRDRRRTPGPELA